MPVQFLEKLPLHALCAVISAGLSIGLVHAQNSPSNPASVPGVQATDKASNPLHEAGPQWSDLNAEQKNILQPLKNLWPSLEENRKRKWLAIAKNFPSLNSQSQATAQERMRQWAAMTPAQRYQARLHFAQAQQLSNEEKLAKWEAYQALNEDEKNKL